MLENQIIHFWGMKNMTTHVDSQVRTTFSCEERHSTLESQPGVSWSLETSLFIWKASEGKTHNSFLLIVYVRQDMLCSSLRLYLY